jgi:hypothetical protein
MSMAAIVVAGAMLLGPGAGLTFLLFPPGKGSLATRLALAIPFGYAVVALLGFLLALSHVLRTAVFVAALTAVTTAVWLPVARRGGFGGHLRRLRSEITAEPVALLAGLAVILMLAVTRLSYSPILNLADQTPLRYWADGLEIADAHHIPTLTLQWGHLVPITVSKVALNAFHGAASLVLGRGPLAPMGALLVVASVGMLLASFGLARELGLRLSAPFVPVLLFANNVIGPRNLTQDLINDKAENWGRLLLLAGVLLAVRALRGHGLPPRADPVASDREEGGSGDARRDALLAGWLFGVGAATHLVPVLVGLSFLAVYGVVRMMFARGLRRRALRAALILGAVTVALGAFLLIAPPGEVGFGGASNTGSYRDLAAEVGQPPSFDPTRYLALGEIEQNAPTRGFYDPPSVTYYEFVRRAVGEQELRRPLRWLFPLAAVAALAILFGWGGPDLRCMAGASFTVMVAIIGVALAFNHHFHVYVLAEFGPRRLFDYTAIPAVLLLAGVGEVALNRLSRWRVPGRGREAPWLGPAAALALLAVLAGFAVPRNVSVGDRERFLSQARPPLSWISRSIPCGGRVLADRRTLATFETFARRAGVLEGMGPYLRPAVLDDAVRSLLDARRFFLDPLANEDYLREQNVAAVVVTAYDQTLGGVGGPLKVARPDRKAISAAPFLRLVARSSTVQVYEVRDFHPVAGRFPDVRELPGYRCGAGG